MKHVGLSLQCPGVSGPGGASTSQVLDSACHSPNLQLTKLLIDDRRLSPLMVKTLIEAIRQIQREGVTLLIADQNVKFARVVAGRGYIMEEGNICHSGRLEELWANEQILRRYLAV